MPIDVSHLCRQGTLGSGDRLWTKVPKLLIEFLKGNVTISFSYTYTGKGAEGTVFGQVLTFALLSFRDGSIGANTDLGLFMFNVGNTVAALVAAVLENAPSEAGTALPPVAAAAA